MFRTLFSLFTLLFILAACSESSLEPETARLSVEENVSPELLVGTPPGKEEIALPILLRETGGIMSEAGISLRETSDATLEERDVLIEAAITDATSISSEAEWFVTTHLGHKMLARILESDEASPDLAAQYTRLLAEAGDPNAHLLRDGLAAARPALSGDEQRLVAQQIVDNAQPEASKAACADCGTKEYRTAMASFRQELSDAVEDVRATYLR